MARIGKESERSKTGKVLYPNCPSGCATRLAFIAFSCQNLRVDNISASHLAEARDRADLTQTQLAALLDVSLRTIVNWERDGGRGVPRKMVDRVRRYLGDALDEVSAADQIALQLKRIPMESLPDMTGSTLARFSDVALLRELLRRAVKRRQNGEEQPDLGQGRGVIDFPAIDVSDLTEDEINSIQEVAEKGQVAKAAGTDETAPLEDDSEHPNDAGA